jgi:hypothetical protein
VLRILGVAAVAGVLGFVIILGRSTGSRKAMPTGQVIILKHAVAGHHARAPRAARH